MDQRVLTVGMPVVVNDVKLRTFGVCGTVDKVSKNAKGSNLCHIKLYEGAPPLKILPEKLKVETIENFYMVVGKISPLSRLIPHPEPGFEKFQAPTIKFTKKERAIEYGKATYGEEFILLEPTVLVKGDIEVTYK